MVAMSDFLSMSLFQRVCMKNHLKLAEEITVKAEPVSSSDSRLLPLIHITL